VVISPDGKRAAFEDWLPGEIYALFVSNLDSSNRKLLAQGNELVVTVPMWSPDSQWIIACVHSDNPNEIPNPRLALIHVDTCQFVPLPYLSGYVGSWLP
jgi:Tol biopolymer transport system component